MVRLVSLGALAATCAQASAHEGDHSLFIGPFYSLNETVVGQTNFTDVSTRFRVAYCIARHQGDKESYTTVFNTGVATPDGPHHPRYWTREEFEDGNSFNVHLNNVADAFANAKGVSINTGFFAFGIQEDLDEIRENARANHMTTFVKDRLSFKKRQFKGDDYFSIDFFMDVPQHNLHAFKRAWRQNRHVAIAKDGILAYAMGVHENEDGSYKVVCQETYANAAVYLRDAPFHPDQQGGIMATGNFSDSPNPFTMTGRADQLTAVKELCDSFQGLSYSCLQYTFDTCEGVGDAVDVVV